MGLSVVFYLAPSLMGVLRKILLFIVFTSLIILVGRLAARYFPATSPAPRGDHGPASPAPALISGDSTNTLPAVLGDTTGGEWREKLFRPLLKGSGLPDKSLRRRTGYWEIVFPKGKPIHEYALFIEQVCRKNGIEVVKGAELRPSNLTVEYHLEHAGNLIKLRATLGKTMLAGSARLALVFLHLDSLKETQLAALEAAPWEKSLVVDPYGSNPVLKKMRFTQERNEVLLELPMEPSTYPYVNPGKQALFIHHTKEEVERLLSAALDSLPMAKGFASKHGDRAIENQPLLDKLFRFTASRRLLFLDLTGSPRSLTRSTAGALGARYRLALIDRDSLHMEEELARRSLLAQKTGETLWVIAYSETGFKRLEKALETHADRMGEMGLELVTLSRLAAAPADSAERAARK